MRALAIAFVATQSVLSALVLTSSPAGATAAPRPGAFGPGSLPIPNGSWSGSCPSSTVLPNLVFAANCQAPDGTLHQSSLPLTNCAQPPLVGNVNGSLACENGPRAVPVSGLWFTTCFEDSMSGSVLSATCMSNTGLAMVSALDISTCRAPLSVANKNGELICESGTVAAAGGKAAQQTRVDAGSQTTVVAQQAPIDTAGFVPATTAQSVSIRNLPKMNGSIVQGTVPRGTPVSVRCQGSWCELSTGQGWVAKSYLNFHGANSGGSVVASRTIVLPPPVPMNQAPGVGGSLGSRTIVLTGPVPMDQNQSGNDAGSTGSRVIINTPGGPLDQQTANNAPAEDRSGCNKIGTARTIDRGAPGVTITFHNTANGARNLIWINESGAPVNYATIPSGGMRIQGTFPQHYWEITDEHGTCTMLYMIGNASGNVNIH